MKKHHNALLIPQYSKFIDARDKALEQILKNALRKQSDQLRAMFSMVIKDVALFIAKGDKQVAILDSQLSTVMHSFIPALVKINKELKWKSYILSHIGEVEAIGRVTNKKTKYDLSAKDIHDAENIKARGLDGDTTERYSMYLNRLKHKIINALQMGMLKKEAPKDIIKRVYSVLPAQKPLPKKALSKIKEAKVDPNDDTEGFAQGFVDDNVWDEIVDDYKNDYIPQNRGPNDFVSGATSDDTDKVYQWEAEKDATEEFVQSVRDGQVDAANDNGITDFVWIAILDDKTDECCTWRDGLLTSEIENELDGAHSDDECDAVTPPAHINCRCRIAPALESVDNDLPSNEKDFDEWLKS